MTKTFKKTNFAKTVKANVANQERQDSNYGYLNLGKGIELYKTKVGNKMIDIIPYIVTNPKHMDRQVIKEDDVDIAAPGTLWYRAAFRVHRNIGISNETVVCPSSFGKPCPICEYRKKKASEGIDKEELRPYNSSKRSLYAVIPIDDKDYKEKVHVLDISDHCFQNKLNEELQFKDKFANFPDLENGYTLSVRFVEQKMGKNAFNEATRIDFEKREAYDESLLEQVPSLDDLLIVLSYEQLKALFYEEDVEMVTEAPEVEEAPIIPRRRTVVVEKEEEPEPEETPAPPQRRRAPVVEQEEETPAAPVRKKPAAPPVEEPEQEEEQTPPQRRKPVEKTPPTSASGGKNKCPHGYTFGVDTDSHPACAKCNAWDDCIDEMDKRNSK